ncbi:MAG: EFR1 family ferrodoxin [Firmicutes bacterium]|nr:EFR1 family ferrodoxin [Bacillota bacterium]MCL2255903.1 EFR1 family ferrodoxin [Bacillota bacterium]
MTIFYFTGTGNSLAVAKKIGGEDGKLISIPQVIDGQTIRFKDDVIGVVFPVYSFRTPMMVREFLSKVHFEADYIFAIGTYGSMSGPCMRYMRKHEKKSYKFNYTNKLRMVDNYLPLFETGKQIAKQEKKHIDKNLAQIVDDISNRKEYHVRAAVAGRVIGKVVNMDFTKSPKKYIVDEKCNKCGVCAKVCLAKNITIEDEVKFDDKCEACYACLHLCPQNALHHKKEKSDKRWLHPDVTVAEIIKANNRLNNAETE